MYLAVSTLMPSCSHEEFRDNCMSSDKFGLALHEGVHLAIVEDCSMPPESLLFTKFFNVASMSVINPQARIMLGFA